MTRDARPRVVVAGGGVAALEACLALRAALEADALAVDLLSPVARFELRSLSVLEPFDATPAWGMDLASFAEDQDLHVVRDGLSGVDVGARAVVTTSGGRLGFDHLLVATGAEPVRAVPGAVTFRGGRDADAVRALVDRSATARSTLAFVAPEGASWTLPLYELALMAAARTGPDGGRAEVLVITPEPTPLHAFGERASAAVGRLLEGHGVRFAGGVAAVAADAGEVELADGAAAARRRGRRAAAPARQPVAGLPHDTEGFLPVDEHGRVTGCDRVFAAGDVTDFPLKQGGLAAQQADAAADAILAASGTRSSRARSGPCSGRPATPTTTPRTSGPRRPAPTPSPSPSRCGGRRARSPAATSRPT